MRGRLTRAWIAAIVFLLAAQRTSMADDLPRRIYQAWKARHESTETLEATFQGTRFTPAKKHTYRVPGGKHVVVPKTDRQDSMRCSFAFSSPSRLYFEITTAAFNPHAVRYEPYRSLMVFTETTIENLTSFDSTGKGDWHVNTCSRSNYTDSVLRLDGAEAAQLLVVYRPFQFENIALFSASSIPALNVTTPSVEIDGYDCAILQGICQQGSGRGYKYELVVRRDPSFLPVRITVAGPGASLDQPLAQKQFKYDDSGALSAWHVKSWDRQRRLRYAEDATVTALVRNRRVGKSRFKIDFPRGCPRKDRLAASANLNGIRNRPYPWIWVLLILGVGLTCAGFFLRIRRERQ